MRPFLPEPVTIIDSASHHDQAISLLKFIHVHVRSQLPAPQPTQPVSQVPTTSSRYLRTGDQMPTGTGGPAQVTKYNTCCL